MVGVGGGSFGWLLFSCMEGVVGVGWMEFFFFRVMKMIVSVVKMIVGLSVMMVWKVE